MPIKFQILIRILSLVILGVRTYDFYRSQPEYTDGQKVSLRLTVTEEPKLTAGRQKIKAITTGGMRVTITTQIASLYDYGDQLQVNGVFTRSEFEGRFYWFLYFPNV